MTIRDAVGVVTRLAAATLILANSTAAQEAAVGGSVEAVTGEPLVGVQVFIPGTSFGTLTDNAGRYRLTGVPPGEHLVRASIIGFGGMEDVVTLSSGELAIVDFALRVSPVAGDRIVATITGERSRRELSSDISTIAAGSVTEDTRANQFTQVLKGQATGVYVRQSSGTVGTGADVRLRGSGSITQGTAPLYVIDGAIIDGNARATGGPLVSSMSVGGQEFTRLSDLNPDEIESIDVIKGPAASALWGARGNAGVILITTKKGVAGDTRWNVRADLGSNRQLNGFVDPAGGRSAVPGQWPTTGWNPLSFGFPTDTLYTQNLLEEFNPFRNALYQNYNGNVTGGAGAANYFGSVQYLNEEGTLPNNAMARFNFRANFDVEPAKRVNLSFSNGYVSSNVHLPDNDQTSLGYIGVAVVGLPWQKPLNGVTDPVTGETVDSCPLAIELAKVTGQATTSFAGSCPEHSFFGNATFDDIAEIVNEKKIERYTGSGSATWTATDRWTNRLTLGYDMVADRTMKLIPVDPGLPFGVDSRGFIRRHHITSRTLTLQGTTSYAQPLASDLDFEFVGGAQWYRQVQEGSDAAGEVLPATGPAINNAVINFAADAYEEQRSIGLFVQGQLAWKDRLFVNGAVRWDDNSAQGERLGMQAYPKVGVSFVALEGPGAVNMLRLRTAWGRSGSLPGPTDALTLLVSGPVAVAGTNQLGISPLRPGNPELAPEVGEEWEAGFDASLWRDRLGLRFTYYDQRTENAIVAADQAPSAGFPNRAFKNIGALHNRGFEVELDALALASRTVAWDWRFIVSTNRNIITELNESIIFGLEGDGQRHQEGLPFGSYVSSVVELGDDGEPRILRCGDTPGTWGPGDTPGAKEDFCDPFNNGRYNGDPTPRWESSVQTTIRLFERVQLYALFDLQTGHHLQNASIGFICALLNTCLDRWEKGEDGQLTDHARIIGFATDSDSEWPYVESADWGKWRTAQVRVDLPSNWSRFLGVKGLSVQFIGENLITWTSYTGLDPEINYAGQNEAVRAEFYTLPPAKRFIATVNISL